MIAFLRDVWYFYRAWRPAQHPYYQADTRRQAVGWAVKQAWFFWRLDRPGQPCSTCGNGFGTAECCKTPPNLDDPEHRKGGCCEAHSPGSTEWKARQRTTEVERGRD